MRVSAHVFQHAFTQKLCVRFPCALAAYLWPVLYVPLSMIFVFVLHRSSSCQRTSWFFPCFCGYRRFAACWQKMIYYCYLFMERMDYLCFVAMINSLWYESMLRSSNHADWANGEWKKPNPNPSSAKCTSLVMGRVSTKRTQICVLKQKNSVCTRLPSQNTSNSSSSVKWSNSSCSSSA